MSGHPPRVAVIGRPNVGKSTLVNRLARQRRSIVGRSPGVTRDIVDTDVSWRGRDFIVHDTGGVLEAAMSSKAREELSAKVAGRALDLVDEADVVVFVVDATQGITAEEEALARRLRRGGTPVVVAANKVDGEHQEPLVAELWGLGLGEPVAVSALHGRGSGDLLDRIVELLVEAGPQIDSGEVRSIAIVGRPNVGKSSLFNRIVGRPRALVHEEPGTTRDPVDTLVGWGEQTYRFLDTAGMRRRARTKGLDVPGTARTQATLERADAAIVVLDAAEGVTTQDQRIARRALQAGASVLVALNKWDLVDEEMGPRLRESVGERLRFLDFAPMVPTSALTGRGVDRLVGGIEEVLSERSKRVPTSRINRLVQEVQQHTPPPRAQGRGPRILYATQAETEPPTFVVFASGPLAPSWLRFLERRIREEHGFVGAPIRIQLRLE